ncbi:PRD domain-containing protein [Haemophilus haemolyticus]|uniref:PRD domain-containing protein n=1 Tax=Haemophilus haemolyticus TaxID=726 RepID=UPI000E0CEAE6|nr:PRD domain-containing protein [Haemophilus haemolyticus]
MRLFKQLERWKIRRQINQSIIDMIFCLRDRLAHYWQVDVNTPQVDFMLLHIACSLGRIERGGCVSPLYPEMLEEIQSAVIFPQVLAIHQDLLKLMPFSIPEAEQTYFLANIHSLVLAQKQLKHVVINKPTYKK